MKKNVKIVVWILAGIAVIGAGAAYLIMPVDIETVTVNPTAAEEYFIEEGSVKSASVISVYPTVSGVIARRFAEEGETIEKGDIICVLDTAELVNTVAISRAALEGYEAQKGAWISGLDATLVGLRGELRNVTAQEADYLAQVANETHLANEAIQKANDAIASGKKRVDAQIKAQEKIVNLLEEAYEQVKSDPTQEPTAKLAVETARAELSVIKKSVERQADPSNLLSATAYTQHFSSLKQSLRENIAIVERQINGGSSEPMHRYYDTIIEGEKARLKSLEKSVIDSTIRSPVSGRIAVLGIKDSNIASTAAPVALIETGRSRDIEVFVTTKDFTDIYLGQTVDITQSASSGDIVFSGVVKEIGSEAETRISTLGVTERVVKVVIEPEEDDRVTFLPGFSFDVRFITYSAESQLLVPKTAVFKYSANKAAGGIIWLDNDMTGKPVADVDMVFDATSGKVVMREVRPGRELRSDYVIEAGLSAGSKVIKDSSDESIRVGMNVR